MLQLLKNLSSVKNNAFLWIQFDITDIWKQWDEKMQ